MKDKLEKLKNQIEKSSAEMSALEKKIEESHKEILQALSQLVDGQRNLKGKKNLTFRWSVID